MRSARPSVPACHLLPAFAASPLSFPPSAGKRAFGFQAAARSLLEIPPASSVLPTPTSSRPMPTLSPSAASAATALLSSATDVPPFYAATLTASGGLHRATTSPGLDEHTVLRIFSMTKLVTSVRPLSVLALYDAVQLTGRERRGWGGWKLAVLQLIDAGRLRLDTPAGDFFPYLRSPEIFLGLDAQGEGILEKAERVVRVEHLLNHSSGLIYAFSNPGP